MASTDVLEGEMIRPPPPSELPSAPPSEPQVPQIEPTNEAPRPPLASVLAEFASRVQELAKLDPTLETRVAILPLVAMLRRVPNSEGAQAEAASALAQLMSDSPGNRSIVEENGGTEALVALLNSKTSTVPMLNAACHAIHMLLRSPENCATAVQAGVIEPLTKVATLGRGELSDGAIPVSGALCHLAESSAHARSLLREAGSADPLAALILVKGGAGSAAAKFSGCELAPLTPRSPHARTRSTTLAIVVTRRLT
mmetsp:Transcript_8690/g.17672  ORF Transcript_8690/g.17672 Transcript_8690/m.17672 type:complete len:255 (-) Transcript_8690:71-835(-)